jgi:hypothetical protein
MNFNRIISLFILVAVLSGVASVEAGFTNTGTFQSRNLNLNFGGTLQNDGQLLASETAKLGCDVLAGTGLIRSPQITIKTSVFAYTGIIDCSGVCTIFTAQAFDDNMFSKVGGGEFIVVVDESLALSKHVQAFAPQDHLEADFLLVR